MEINNQHIQKPNNQKMVSISTNLTEKLIISVVSLSWYIVLAMICYKRICKFFQNFTKFFKITNKIYNSWKIQV